MDERKTGRSRPSLPDLALYVLTGLVAFTVVRLALAEYGVTGWPATVASLAAMLVALEGLTSAGWLERPFDAEEGERN